MAAIETLRIILFTGYASQMSLKSHRGLKGIIRFI